MSLLLNKLSYRRNQYCAFGLNIDSEIQLSELIVPTKGFEDEEIDVSITLGKVPDYIQDVNVSTPYVQISKNQFILRIPDKLCLLVENGCRIIVEPLVGCSTKEASVYVLCSAFGALFHQRGIIALHASVLKVGDFCAVFCGESGAGKSTLARSLIERGYELQGDDLGVIHFHKNNVPYVYPAYPQMKLWNESLEVLGHTSEGLSKVMPDMDKYRVPADGFFHKKPLKLGKVYMLSYDENTSVELSHVTGFKKFNLLMENIYRIEFAHAMERTSQVFDNLKDISPFLKMSELKRPKLISYMPDVLDTLEADFSVWR